MPSLFPDLNLVVASKNKLRNMFRKYTSLFLFHDKYDNPEIFHLVAAET